MCYWHDHWNKLDFLVVIAGLTSLFGGQGSELAFVRTLRILRPLRTLKQLPGLRLLVEVRSRGHSDAWRSERELLHLDMPTTCLAGGPAMSARRGCQGWLWTVTSAWLTSAQLIVVWP